MHRNAFITEDFLLETDHAKRLYEEYALGMPIIDYHCHLPPEHIAADHCWQNIAQLWLQGDHYKWRAMRSNGVPERYCTGGAPDWEKFEKWAATMPMLLRSPLYEWTHLELKRYFDISNRLLCPETAQGIWKDCNKKLALPEFSCRGLMKRSNVVLICTTDDPADSLEHHKSIADDQSFGIQVLPTWRPDCGMAVEDPAVFNAWVDKLAAAAGADIGSFDSYIQALRKRHAAFHQAGCRLSDHGIETVFSEDCTGLQAKAVFNKIRGGAALDRDEVLKFKSAMLYEFGIMDHERGWTQQYHLGALRNASSRMFRTLGPDTGFDAIGDIGIARPLARLLDRLDKSNQLARTILYNINPRDNVLLTALIGCFQDGSVPGKMQFGSAWWFMDNKEGIEQQLNALSRGGLLGRFVGMLTDSRSFLSFTRHEYFRRILCNMLGNDMAKGIIPRDMELAGNMVRDICYNNAANYFGFDVPVLLK